MTPIPDVELIRRLLTAALLGAVLGVRAGNPPEERRAPHQYPHRGRRGALHADVRRAGGARRRPGAHRRTDRHRHRLSRRRRHHAHRQRHPRADYRRNRVGQRRGRRGRGRRLVPPRVHCHGRHHRRAARAAAARKRDRAALRQARDNSQKPEARTYQPYPTAVPPDFARRAGLLERHRRAARLDPRGGDHGRGCRDRFGQPPLENRPDPAEEHREVLGCRRDRVPSPQSCQPRGSVCASGKPEISASKTKSRGLGTGPIGCGTMRRIGRFRSNSSVSKRE